MTGIVINVETYHMTFLDDLERRGQIDFGPELLGEYFTLPPMAAAGIWVIWMELKDGTAATQVIH
jgi:hypothetical protein